ncbi:hypothetical protein B0J14DRAFT_706117 [Halenospora varia]|nr:hypothetical protein B0J14DRAFT_706117 [Halenospora varia]
MRSTITFLVCGVLASMSTAGEVGEMPINRGDLDFALFPRATVTNLQEFSAALGGATAPPITASGNTKAPFAVGSKTVTSYNDAITESCSQQAQACKKLANGPTGQGGGSSGDSATALTVNNCDDQNAKCLTAGKSATVTGFNVLKSSDAANFYFCDS